MSIRELPPLNYIIMSKAQVSDNIFRLLNDQPNSLQLAFLSLPNSPNGNLLGDVSLGHFRSVVPQLLRKHAFTSIHFLDLPGVKKMAQFLSVWFYSECVFFNSQPAISRPILSSLLRRFAVAITIRVVFYKKLFIGKSTPLYCIPYNLGDISPPAHSSVM